MYPTVLIFPYARLFLSKRAYFIIRYPTCNGAGKFILLRTQKFCIARMINKCKLHEYSDCIGVAQNVQTVDTGLRSLCAAIHSSKRIHNLILDALRQLLPFAAPVVVPDLRPLCYVAPRTGRVD